MKNNKLLLRKTCMNITNVMSRKRFTLYDSIYLKFKKSEMTSGVSGLQSGHLCGDCDRGSIASTAVSSGSGALTNPALFSVCIILQYTQIFTKYSQV